MMQIALFWPKLLPALFLKKPWYPCPFEILEETLYSVSVIPECFGLIASISVLELLWMISHHVLSVQAGGTCLMLTLCVNLVLRLSLSSWSRLPVRGQYSCVERCYGEAT
jgi:hypothetical protein